MAHVTSGIRKILELPYIYNSFQYLIGGLRYKRAYFTNYFDLPNGSRVLDFGCGTADLLSFLDKDVEYFGIDIEENYINWNRRKFIDRGTFILENVVDVERSDWFNYFDAINAHGLLHHMSNSDCSILIERAFQYLKPSGYLVTVDSVFHEDQSKLSRWLVSRDRGQNVNTPAGYLELAKQKFDLVDGKIISDHLTIPFSIFVMVMTKS